MSQTGSVSRDAIFLLQDFKRCRHGGQILLLINPRQVHAVDAQRALLFRCKNNLTAALGGGAFENRPCRAVDLADHRGYAGLYDSRLLKGNFFQSVAQIESVFQAYIGDYAQNRGDYVCGIQPAAEAAFNHSQVHASRGKKVKCHGGGDFEERGSFALHKSFVLIQKGLHGLARNHLETVFRNYLYPFSKIHQMGRGVEADPLSAAAQCRRQKGTYAALAIGAGNVD